MIDLAVKIIPGLAISCAFFLMAVAFVQWMIYSKTGYERSKVLSFCALVAVVESVNHFVSQSRLFSVYGTLIFLHFAIILIHLYMVLYLKSLSYYIAIPTRLFNGYSLVFLGLTAYFLFGLVYFIIVGKSLYFLGDQVSPSGNYFLDSYQLRFGTATVYITVPLAIAALSSISMASFLIARLYRSSRDIYFLIGLALTILFNFRESLLLPFSVEVYVPLIFLGNIFEIFRMNTLSYREYFSEKVDQVKRGQEKPQAKYQNSNLSDDRVKQLGEKLHKLLIEKELYLNPNLSSEDLANALGVPSYQLSQVINIGLEKTFFELLSEYRIKRVIEKFKDPSQAAKTIIDIAYETGFNSKSSFNTSFKKQTGVTPSTFRKDLNKP